MQTEVLWALGPPGLIGLGFCLLWAQSWMRQYGTTARRVFDSRLATLLIWIILLVGVLATTLINVLFLAPPLWIVAGIVLAAAVSVARANNAVGAYHRRAALEMADWLKP